MTRKKFRKLYYDIFADTFLRNEFWCLHRDMLMSLSSNACAVHFILTQGQIYMKAYEEKKGWWGLNVKPPLPPIQLGNCVPAATPPQQFCTDEDCRGCDFPKQEKGNNPMRYEQVNATAVIAQSKSDEALQREYLLAQLQDYLRYTWKETSKDAELRKMFFLNTPHTPRYGKELLDAIKNGKYVVDEKKLARGEATRLDQSYDEDEDDCGRYDLFYGITFTDYPKPDMKGYEAASEAFAKASKDTERKIIVGTPAEGLDALLALEAWVPAGKAN